MIAIITTHQVLLLSEHPERFPKNIFITSFQFMPQKKIGETEKKDGLSQKNSILTLVFVRAICYNIY